MTWVWEPTNRFKWFAIRPRVFKAQLMGYELRQLWVKKATNEREWRPVPFDTEEDDEKPSALSAFGENLR
jgi:hypothetical protein